MNSLEAMYRHGVRKNRPSPVMASVEGRKDVVRRIIKDHAYYYLISRENGRFRSVYRGKSVPPAELRRYREAKAKRAKYRRSLSQLKKQIRYLKGALRGKEEI